MPVLDGARASKYFNLGYTPQGQHQRMTPARGHLGQGICGLSGVILWLAESRCQHFSQGGRAVRMEGTSPVMRKGNQGRKKENFHYQGRIIRVGRMQGHPATLCQASTHHSGPQRLSKCSVLSLNNSNSLFWAWRAYKSQQCQTHICLAGTEQVLAGGRAQQDSPQSQDTMREKEMDTGSRDHFRSHELLVPETPHRDGWLRGIPTPLPAAEESSAQPALCAAASSQPGETAASGSGGSAENVMPEKINKAANEVICIAISSQDLQRV